MGKIGAYAILAVCLWIGWQSYNNAQPDPTIEHMSKLEACGGSPSCVLEREQPEKVVTDALRQRHQWRTSDGSRVVTCTRQYLWLGAWGCTSEDGRL